jgi:hypothetical protein
MALHDDRLVTARRGVLVAAALCCLAAPARAEDSASSKGFYEIETKYIFGFTEGSGIGLEGEKEFSVDTIGRFGKRDGRYAATETKFEFEYTPNQYIQVEFGPLAAGHNIRGVTDLDDRHAITLSGFFGELRYLVFDRPSSPVAVTVSFEPVYRAFDETGGERVENYEFETKLQADVELVKNRLYAAANLIYEPETTRIMSGDWEKESKFGLTGALSYRVLPELAIGIEADYYRHYDGLLFETFTGDALFIGPTLYYKFARKMFLAAAWNAQVWGREVETSNRFNLAEFSPQRAKLKVALEF